MKVYRAMCDDCGFTRTYWSEAKAEYALRQHSCDKHRARAAARARRQARLAVVDRTPKPCLHKQADHQCGTHAKYVLDRCRCPDCSAATAAYEQNRTRQKAYGRWNGLVDAQPARDHVRALMAAGLGLKRIAVMSGVSQGVLWKLMYGKRRPDGSQVPSARIRPSTAAALLAVTADLDNLASRVTVDPTGTRRRLQALVAYGWSQSKLARRLGWQVSNFNAMFTGREGVSAATARAVRDLYEQLQLTPPPEATHRDKIAATRARRYAVARGWAPPLAWDDEQLDDPTATPHVDTDDLDVADHAAVQRFVEGDRTVRLTHADRVEVARRLCAAGWSGNRIMRELHVNGRTWSRIREEAREAVAA